MAKKLHYFDISGIAESVRYILHYAGQKFEDVRYDRATWPDKKVKESLPYGQLPLYEEGNKRLHQSLAIARYVASQTKLLPTDSWEQAVLDSIVFTIYDFWSNVTPYITETDPVKREQIKKEVLKNVVDFYFSRFEKTLKENGGTFVGKLTWADFVFIGIIESTNLYLATEIEKAYPTIRALVLKIKSLPGVKEYIAKRGEYKV